MEHTVSLDSLKEGAFAFVEHIEAQPAMGRRLLELGLIPGTRVSCVGESPAGDPRAYLIRGAVIALRRRDAAGIYTTDATEAAGATALWAV